MVRVCPGRTCYVKPAHGGRVRISLSGNYDRLRPCVVRVKGCQLDEIRGMSDTGVLIRRAADGDFVHSPVYLNHACHPSMIRFNWVKLPGKHVSSLT